jgi:hypothetical protein
MTTENLLGTVIATIIIAPVLVAMTIMAFGPVAIETRQDVFSHRVARTLERYNARYRRIK